MYPRAHQGQASLNRQATAWRANARQVATEASLRAPAATCSVVAATCPECARFLAELRSVGAEGGRLNGPKRVGDRMRTLQHPEAVRDTCADFGPINVNVLMLGPRCAMQEQTVGAGVLREAVRGDWLVSTRATIP